MGRTFSIVAKDPSFGIGGPLLTTVEVADEPLWPGPTGHRIHVIDYDSSSDRILRAADDPGNDRHPSSDEVLRSVHFHQQNVYAVAMATLERFESALGRRMRWAFRQRGHQIKIAPHAFREANAYYAREFEALLFGYVGTPTRPILTCLSHDVVVHETTHAVLDGLRERYLYPAYPDQAAFHEGFADVVALLSVIRERDVLQLLLETEAGESAKSGMIPSGRFSREGLRSSVVSLLAPELDFQRGNALRQSVALDPEDVDLSSIEFEAPHRRGEVFVAAIMRAFTSHWADRVGDLDTHKLGSTTYTDTQAAAESGCAIANELLDLVIRAIDYTPPVNLLFSDFLTALITANLELRGDRALHKALVGSFASYGIEPAEGSTREGAWPLLESTVFDRGGSHLESLRHDPDEVFRFLWANRDRSELGLYKHAYTAVQSVRPRMRRAPDGFRLRETIAEYRQVLHIRGGDLHGLGLRRAKGVGLKQDVRLYGGGTLIFNEFGEVRYHVPSPLLGGRQQHRIDYLHGASELGANAQGVRRSLTELHRRRIRDARVLEGW